MSVREIRNLPERLPDVYESLRLAAQVLRGRAHPRVMEAVLQHALSTFECELEDAVHRSKHARADDPHLQFARRDLHERLGSMRFRPVGSSLTDRVETFIREAGEIWRGELEAARTSEELAEALTRAVDHVHDFLLGVDAIYATTPAVETKLLIQAKYARLISETFARQHPRATLPDVRGWQEVERRAEEPVESDEARSGAPHSFWPDVPHVV